VVRKEEYEVRIKEEEEEKKRKKAESNVVKIVY